MSFAKSHLGIKWNWTYFNAYEQYWNIFWREYFIKKDSSCLIHKLKNDFS